MPDQNSIGYDLESWGIALLRSKVAVAAGLQVVHEAGDDRADSDRVVLTGVETGEDWEGPGTAENPVSRMELRIELRMVEKNAAKLESYFSAIQRAFRVRPYPDLAEDSLFSVRIPLPDGTEVKTALENTRSRECSFTFLAMQADSDHGDTYLQPDGIGLYFQPDGVSLYLVP